MLNKIFKVLIIIIVFLTIPTTLKISTNNPIEKEEKIVQQSNQKNQIGELKIEKLNLQEPLFNINSQENTIEKHITILKESIFPQHENSIMFIAAHSGTGKIAYFEELDQLKLNDTIILTLENKNYFYQVKDIWEEKKNGYINVNKENKKQLVLTTCSPNHPSYQLVINCIEKASTN